MKITTAWAQPETPDTMPWLISAYDDGTEYEWNGTPDWYTEAVRKQGREFVRELVITVPDEAVETLFDVSETEGTVEP